MPPTVQPPRVQECFSPPRVNIPSFDTSPAPSPTPTPAPPATSTPSRYPTRVRHAPSRYGFAATTLADQLHNKKYAGHIAALVADSSPTKVSKLPSLAKLLKGCDASVWSRGTANEFGRLLPRGIGNNRPAHERLTGTGTIYPIRKTDVPLGRTVTYINFICAIRPNKEEKHRVRATFGGDQLDFPGDPSSPSTSILTTKIHLNSTISDARKGARYFTLDIKNFFLGSPMEYFQYARVPASIIPQEVFDEYPEMVVEADGYVYFEARKGIYGLKEAGLLAFKHLVTNLKPHGYEPMPFTPGLWRHITRPTTFTLCVDDFGVKYFSTDDANHLITAIQTNYDTTIDWSGSLYCGLNLEWNYDAGYVDVSMNDYVKRSLERFQHVPTSSRIQHAPHPWNQPTYGKSTPQSPTISPLSPPLDLKGTRRIQAIAGTFNFYSEVDPCIKPALNEIGTVQAKPTMNTNAKAQMLMDYLHYHPNAVLRFHASDMVLQVESDAAYLVLPHAHSRAAAWYILGNDPTTTPTPMTNSPVHVMCNTIKNVMASAAEAETGGLFLAAQRACPMRVTLEELGHPQPTNGTPLFNDNSTATGILTASIRPKLSKAFDMRFHWLNDRVNNKQFQIIWRKGKLNMADYFTKHHPPWHHKVMRYRYLHKALSLRQVSPVRGCITSLLSARCLPLTNTLRHARFTSCATSSYRQSSIPPITPPMMGVLST